MWGLSMGGNIRCGYQWEGILDVGLSMGGNIICGVINGREY